MVSPKQDKLQMAEILHKMSHSIWKLYSNSVRVGMLCYFLRISPVRSAYDYVGEMLTGKGYIGTAQKAEIKVDLLKMCNNMLKRVFVF